MKQTLSILFLLTIGLTVYSQKDNKATDSFRYLRNLGIIANRQKDSTKIKNEDIRLTGKSVGEIHLMPPCGIFAWATVLEFEVINIIGLTYKNKNIEIIVGCPDMYGDGFFENGKLYQVTFSLSGKSDSSWIIPNRNLLKKNHLMFDPFATAIKNIP